MTAQTRAIAPKLRRVDPSSTERSVISAHDLADPKRRIAVMVIGIGLLIVLVVASVGPLFWLFKAATSTTTESLSEPLSLWPSGFHIENFVVAFEQIQFGKYLLNTLWVCIGCWFFSLIVATTAGYALAILRPRYAKIMEGAVLATLFIPGVVSLVSLYLTVVDVPIVGGSLINTFWAVWLPAAASAFNIIIVQRFFVSLPHEIFEAAEVDGAGPVRIFVSIVLPLSKPVIGVVSLISIIAAYKDFLWPLLVLPSAQLQPLSVALPRLESSTDFAVFLAALFASVVVPVSFFLIFQKQFLSAAGSSGALKG